MSVFQSGRYRKDGPWQVLSRGIWTVTTDVPVEVVAEHVKWVSEAPFRIAEERWNGGDAEQAHLEALEVDFVVRAYIDGTDPRMFVVGEEIVDVGVFTLVAGEHFGWHGQTATWMRRVHQALLDAGKRVREEVSHPNANRTAGVGAYLPLSVRDVPVM